MLYIGQLPDVWQARRAPPCGPPGCSLSCCLDATRSALWWLMPGPATDHRIPLAVRRHYAEFRYGSMVLAGGAGAASQRVAALFSVLIMERDDLFVIRPWDRRDWTRVEIRPGLPVPAAAGRLIGSSVPVPRDGALLGWVDGGQIRAIVVARGRLPEPWDDPSVVPGLAVLPLAGSDPARWPPGSLPEERLWEHAARGQLADVPALIGRRAGYAYWVPEAITRHGGCIVVAERLGTPQCWLAAGVYADHSALREGIQVPPARELLAMPGVADLAHGTPVPGQPAAV
jgi:hypothetical protein